MLCTNLWWVEVDVHKMVSSPVSWGRRGMGVALSGYFVPVYVCVYCVCLYDIGCVCLCISLCCISASRYLSMCEDLSVLSE